MVDKDVSHMQKLFVELLHVTVGSCTKLSVIPSNKEWQCLYKMANKQALIGVCFHGVKQLPKEQLVNMPLQLKMQWLGITANIQKRNEVMDIRCRQLQKQLADFGFSGCVLKGQGVAFMYPKELSSLRQSGDIDVWVKGGFSSVKALAKKMNQHVKATEQHVDLTFFKDAEVEVHIIPTMLRNPFANRRLQKWINEQNETQFLNKNDKGMCVPTLEFNLVYMMIHTYRHLFAEGVGLRQVMDYYMLLCSEYISIELKEKTMKCMRLLHIDKFAAGLMWVMNKVFGLTEDKMLCNPNERHGAFILNEIMTAGNMGHYDERLVTMYNAPKLRRFLLMNRHTLRLFKYYPQETFFTPITRMWTWVWRNSLTFDRDYCYGKRNI